MNSELGILSTVNILAKNPAGIFTVVDIFYPAHQMIYRAPIISPIIEQNRIGCEERRFNENFSNLDH